MVSHVNGLAHRCLLLWRSTGWCLNRRWFSLAELALGWGKLGQRCPPTWHPNAPPVLRQFSPKSSFTHVEMLVGPNIICWVFMGGAQPTSTNHEMTTWWKMMKAVSFRRYILFMEVSFLAQYENRAPLLATFCAAGDMLSKVHPMIDSDPGRIVLLLLGVSVVP